MARPLPSSSVVDQLVNEATLLATLHLKACLLADSQQSGVSDALDLRLWGKSELREGGYGVHAAPSQRLPLVPRDSGDERRGGRQSLRRLSHSGNHEHTSQCSVGSG